ncbi:DNA alkylation repair protein [Actinocrispum wychmicini]|uniref:3-methyladenine DNA glycosylase AlkD n=1 Tax=Actinocrispum wychmicini TaxID=1213861 RepID=A0A4R2IG51_9PSEU|nr:DNA alkylation repair protein [Actinocrispum wychmicini]TCO43781.1 3-methyladenine DNA glycosylase AlkD [Actinocrispum wychmicini]
MPKTTHRTLVKAGRAGLAELADPEKAVDMRKYMKSEMPYRGVSKPQRAALIKRLMAEHQLSDVDALVAAALELWRAAKYREERYLAIDLTGQRPYAAWQDVSLMPLYEEMIVTGAWWDYVDEVAVRRIGPLLRDNPVALTPTMRAWSTDPDPWRRRTSIICQVGSKAKTDTALLADCIVASVDDPGFFLRKGIGWALRQHSKVDAAWVRAFVDAHPELSPLSRREATKYL